LLLATKLLPARYALRTWMISTAGLAKDISQLRWKFVADRIAVLFHMAGLIVQLLREKNALFRNASISPEEQLDSLLRLTDDDVRANRCE
jgi:hypothetical protein